MAVPSPRAEDAAHVLRACKHCHGFYGASSMERLPTEQALTAATREFKGLTFCCLQAPHAPFSVYRRTPSFLHRIRFDRSPACRTPYISAIIHAPLEQVWPMFRDFNGLAGWHPGVAVSRLEDGRADALGSVRHLTLQPSGFVREQLLMLDDPGTALRYSIIETDLPMRDYVAGVQLRRVTEGGLTRWSNGGPTSASRPAPIWRPWPAPWGRACSRRG